jgi:hypothetical protein
VNVLDMVQSTVDLPEEDLVAGTLGTIVHVFHTPRLAYEVEFIDDSGTTIAIATVSPDQIVAVPPQP